MMISAPYREKCVNSNRTDYTMKDNLNQPQKQYIHQLVKRAAETIKMKNNTYVSLNQR